MSRLARTFIAGLLVVLPPADAAELRGLYAAAGQPCWEVGEVTEGAGIVVE